MLQRYRRRQHALGRDFLENLGQDTPAIGNRVERDDQIVSLTFDAKVPSPSLNLVRGIPLVAQR